MMQKHLLLVYVQVSPARSPSPPPGPLPTSAPSTFLYLISVCKYACVHEEYIERFAYSWF